MECTDRIVSSEIIDLLCHLKIKLSKLFHTESRLDQNLAQYQDSNFNHSPNNSYGTDERDSNLYLMAITIAISHVGTKKKLNILFSEAVKCVVYLWFSLWGHKIDKTNMKSKYLRVKH